MTAYVFAPDPGTSQPAWSDAAIWSGGVAPDGPDADVTIPAAVDGSGHAVSSILVVDGAYEVHTLQAASNEIDLDWSGSLTVDAAMVLSGGAVLKFIGGGVSAEETVIGSGAAISGAGVLSGPVEDEGLIRAGWLSTAEAGMGGGLRLTIDGPVTGAGLMQVGRRDVGYLQGGINYVLYPSELELGGADSVDIQFLDQVGVVILDHPSLVSGGIALTPGDQIVLKGLDLSAVSGESYAGTADGGVLTLQTADGPIALHILGDYNLDDFTLSAFSGLIYDDPAGVAISVIRAASNPDAFGGDGLSEALIQDTAGDLVVGALSGGRMAYTAVGALGPEWSVEATGRFYGGSQDEFLIRDAAGAVAVGQVVDSQAQYSLVAGLGSGWSFVGAGDMLGDGRDQFLITNGAGGYYAGDISNGAVTYTALAGLGPEWTVQGAGGFMPSSRLDGVTADQFLIEDATGDLLVGQFVANPSQGFPTPPPYTRYLQAGSLAGGWTLAETGDFLGHGQDDILIRNASGAIAVGEIGSSGGFQFTAVGYLGSEWRIVGAGAFDRSQPTGFLIESTAGQVDLGVVVNGAVRYAQIGALGPEWSFRG